MIRILSVAAAAMLAIVVSVPDDVGAAEQAQGVYALGAKGSMAGVLPPPGIYLSDLNYYYAGDAQGQAALAIVLPRTGARTGSGALLTVEADVSVRANAYYNAPTVLWVTPHTLFGGNLAFALTTPVGREDVKADIDARVALTLPPPINTTLAAGRRLQIQDDRTAFGDPLASAILGWHVGNWHWNVSATVNVPIGQWDRGQLANIGFNRWAVDTAAAVTWLDPMIGLEISAAFGTTFNWENPDTNYRTGTEFHVEFAAMKHVSKTFAVGLSGYHYQQLTGDSGAGAVLGDFKGRTTALGPAMNLNFALGAIPVNTSVRWLHEFDVENRTKGEVGILTVTLPLSAPTPPPPPASLK